MIRRVKKVLLRRSYRDLFRLPAPHCCKRDGLVYLPAGSGDSTLFVWSIGWISAAIKLLLSVYLMVYLLILKFIWCLIVLKIWWLACAMHITWGWRWCIFIIVSNLVGDCFAGSLCLLKSVLTLFVRFVRVFLLI